MRSQLQREIDVDVAVVGAGICGLLATYKLSRLGASVALIEQAGKVASGASSKNEGWLHKGSYHASAVLERSEALRIARRCSYGFNQIQNLVPEAVESSERPTIALVRDPDRCAEAKDRWREAGIPFDPMSKKDAKRLLDGADLSSLCQAFRTHDVGINTHILYRYLLTSSITCNAQVLLSHKFHFDQEGFPRCISASGDSQRINARVVIVAAGAGSKELLSQLNSQLPVRLWKSHILYGKRIMEQPVFWLDPLEITLINHTGNVSVVGLNEDAYQINDVDLDVDPGRADLVHEAFGRFIPHSQASKFSPVACIKIDVRSESSPRSVEAEFYEPIDGVYFLFPGKMTEAPFIVDSVVKQVSTRLVDDWISRRPWTEHEFGDQ